MKLKFYSLAFLLAVGRIPASTESLPSGGHGQSELPLGWEAVPPSPSDQRFPGGAVFSQALQAYGNTVDHVHGKVERQEEELASLRAELDDLRSSYRMSVGELEKEIRERKLLQAYVNELGTRLNGLAAQLNQIQIAPLVVTTTHMMGNPEQVKEIATSTPTFNGPQERVQGTAQHSRTPSESGTSCPSLYQERMPQYRIGSGSVTVPPPQKISQQVPNYAPFCQDPRGVRHRERSYPAQDGFLTHRGSGVPATLPLPPGSQNLHYSNSVGILPPGLLQPNLGGLTLRSNSTGRLTPSPQGSPVGASIGPASHPSLSGPFFCKYSG